MRLAEQIKIVPLIAPADHNSAGKDSDSFSMENYGHATIVIVFGSLTGEPAVLTISEGATVGLKTTAKDFNYRVTSADIAAVADADKLAAEVATTTQELSLTLAVYKNRMLVIEIDDSELTDGCPWITGNLSVAGTVVQAAVVAILSQPRYAGNVPPTAIV